MGLYFQINRIKNKFLRVYEKQVFKELTGCPHNDFQIVGSITLINTNIRVGKGVTIYPGAMFWGDGLIQIGDHVDIGKDTIIYSSRGRGGVVIGKDTQIAAQCYLIDMDHGIQKGIPVRMQGNKAEKVIIGEDVWIAANCTILKGSKIGNGAVVAAKALVKGFVAENTVVAGVPAKKIGVRE